jgi:hypothetical protein
MTQFPFAPSNTCASFPLQIVYKDVWGPASITSINGFCYYVSFIDAYSHFTWFFPLKHKSQILSSFLYFKNTMENLLGTSIKIFCTNCGGNIPRMIFNLFVLPMVYFINSLALIHHNKMVFPRENIVTLLIWHYLSFLIHCYPSLIVHMILLPRFFLLIVFHLLYGIMSLLGKFYLVIFPIINPSRFLVVLVILYVHTHLINFLFVLLNVYFLVMPLMPRAIFVLIPLHLIYIRHVMLFFMKPHFHSLILSSLIHLLHHPLILILG